MRRQEVVAQLVRDDPRFALEETTVDGVPWRVYRNAARSMRDVLVQTEALGDLAFLRYGDERWTYAEHLGIVRGLAARWASLGVRKGDRVAIAMRNYPEFVFTFWVTQALGAIAVPLNAWWTASELSYALHDCRPVLLVADSERIERLERELPELGIDRVLAVRTRRAFDDDVVVAWDDELAAIDASAPFPAVEVEPDDDSTILYTSGTTGAPKGAVATHRNHTTNLRNGELEGAVAAEMTGAATPHTRAQPSRLQVFPLFHIAGLNTLYLALAAGARLSLMHRWDADTALRLIDEESISVISMVPSVLRDLLDRADALGESLDGITRVSMGGAPIPPELVRRVEARFHGRVVPGNGYGLTETTSAVVTNSGDEYFAHPDSLGRPVPVADLRIVDPDSGSDVAPGEVGELWIRGPNIVRGYWQRPHETAAAFTDGWFHTGDLGRIDDEGLVYVVDRLKDVILRSGENVYCAEVEAVLAAHAAVADVAVIGLPHPDWGEEVVAVVEVEPGSTVDVTVLRAHAARTLAHFKVPTRVELIDRELPRTATGKVLKRDLRAMFAEG